MENNEQFFCFYVALFFLGAICNFTKFYNTENELAELQLGVVAAFFSHLAPLMDIFADDDQHSAEWKVPANASVYRFCALIL